MKVYKHVRNTLGTHCFPWKHGRTPRNEGMDNALKTLKYSVLLMCSKRVPAGMDNALKTLKYNVLLMCS
jgi:hypothetical protein